MEIILKAVLASIVPAIEQPAHVVLVTNEDVIAINVTVVEKHKVLVALLWTAAALQVDEAQVVIFEDFLGMVQAFVD